MWLIQDASDVRPTEFVLEENLRMVVHGINSLLSSSVQDYATSIQDELWGALEEVIAPRNCAIYSFNPEPGCSPMDDGGSMYAPTCLPVHVLRV